MTEDRKEQTCPGSNPMVWFIVADPGGASEAQAPPAPVKTSQKKRWPQPWAASFKSHRAPPRTNFWIRYWFIRRTIGVSIS